MSRWDFHELHFFATEVDVDDLSLAFFAFPGVSFQGAFYLAAFLLFPLLLVKLVLFPGH